MKSRLVTLGALFAFSMAQPCSIIPNQPLDSRSRAELNHVLDSSYEEISSMTGVRRLYSYGLNGHLTAKIRFETFETIGTISRYYRLKCEKMSDLDWACGELTVGRSIAIRDADGTVDIDDQISSAVAKQIVSSIETDSKAPIQDLNLGQIDPYQHGGYSVYVDSGDPCFGLAIIVKEVDCSLGACRLEVDDSVLRAFLGDA